MTYEERTAENERRRGLFQALRSFFQGRASRRDLAEKAPELTSLFLTTIQPAKKAQKKAKMPLGQILVKKHRVISPEDLVTALAKQQEANKRLGEILIEMGLITEEQLTAALQEQRKPSDPWGDALG